jgi:hypothetical protein
MKEKFSMKLLQQWMALFLSSSLVLVGVRDGFGYQFGAQAMIDRLFTAERAWASSSLSYPS